MTRNRRMGSSYTVPSCGGHSQSSREWNNNAALDQHTTTGTILSQQQFPRSLVYLVIVPCRLHCSPRTPKRWILPVMMAKFKSFHKCGLFRRMFKRLSPNFPIRCSPLCRHPRPPRPQFASVMPKHGVGVVQIVIVTVLHIFVIVLLIVSNHHLQRSRSWRWVIPVDSDWSSIACHILAVVFVTNRAKWYFEGRLN